MNALFAAMRSLSPVFLSGTLLAWAPQASAHLHNGNPSTKRSETREKTSAPAEEHLLSLPRDPADNISADKTEDSDTKIRTPRSNRSGSIDRRSVWARLGEQQDVLGRCYNKNAKPGLASEYFIIQFVIGEDGRVYDLTAIHVPSGNHALVKCIFGMLTQTRFPIAKGGAAGFQHRFSFYR